jgi:hypothetical protein
VALSRTSLIPAALVIDSSAHEGRWYQFFVLRAAPLRRHSIRQSEWNLCRLRPKPTRGSQFASELGARRRAIPVGP